MFTDANLEKLHRNKEYIRSNNSWRNRKLASTIVKGGGIGAAFSITLVSNGNLSFGINFIHALWFIFRYHYITKEITECRSKIIESLLNKEFKCERERLIKNSIAVSSYWMEYCLEKIAFLQKTCLEYILTPENRTILSQHSDLSKQECIKILMETQTIIDDLFSNSISRLLRLKNHLTYLSYSCILEDKTKSDEIIEVFIENGKSGNLTRDNVKEEEENG